LLAVGTAGKTDAASLRSALPKAAKLVDLAADCRPVAEARGKVRLADAFWTPVEVINLAGRAGGFACGAQRGAAGRISIMPHIDPANFRPIYFVYHLIRIWPSCCPDVDLRGRLLVRACGGHPLKLGRNLGRRG
jgi:hypothetical protein